MRNYFPYSAKFALKIKCNNLKKREMWILDMNYRERLDSVLTFSTRKDGVAAVFRTIPSEILTAKQLGLPGICQKFAKLSKGLVLVTGPTGSGKSTTLAAIIDYANKVRTDHILTVEDPIEFAHKSRESLINHREVGLHTETFASALRAASREDPGIILVGEMRDLETINLALEASATGYLVFGTLHTPSAAKTIDRIIDVFPASQQNQVRTTLSESIKGVIAQNLFKRSRQTRTGSRLGDPRC